MSRSPRPALGASAGGTRVVVVGDVVTDVIAVLSGPMAPGSDAPATVRLTGGGQAANTAAWLAAIGVPVTLIAAVGDDEAGRARVAELSHLGVDCVVSTHRDQPTGTVVVLAGRAERTMLTDRGANQRLRSQQLEMVLATVPDVGHLHLSAYPLLDPASRAAGRRALEIARGHGLTISVDAASAAPLRHVGAAAFLSWVRGIDLLLLNAAEAAVLVDGLPAAPAPSPVSLARALARTVGQAVVKCGAAGAVWAGPDERVTEVPAHQAAVVDVTGAGDAFAAGLLAAWLSGADPAAALDHARRLGARAVSTVGARPSG